MQLNITTGPLCVSGRSAPALGWPARASLNLAILALLVVAPYAMAQKTGSIEGKVTDSSGAPIFEAVVTVESAGQNPFKTVTDSGGAFQVAGLPPGTYNVKISASGLSAWSASDVTASAAPESKPLHAVMQVAPTVTTVTVGLSPEEVAAEQLKNETHQRVMGLVPNYFVAYEHHAAPLSPKQKFDLSLKTLIDPATFTAVGITAAIQQSKDSYHQFGQGSDGFGRRFGAAYGTVATNLLITSALAESALHQDPRYFYSGRGTKRQRAWYAVESAFRARGDNGKWQPPYAGMAGAIAAAEISDLYYPGSRTQYTLLGRSLMFHFAGLIGLNLSEELLLKKFTSHAPVDSAANDAPILREGSPVTLIAVDGFGAAAGQTVRFVLAEDLTQNGKVLAGTGDVATGLVTQVSPESAPNAAGSVVLQNVTLRASNMSIPLRGSRVRGAATPVQYKKLPGSGKVEVTLFIAQTVKFPEKE